MKITAPEFCERGDTIEFSFKDDVEYGYYSWLGIYNVDADDSSYVSYIYQTEIEINKKYELVMPNKAGHYNIRFFTTKEYECSAISNNILCGPQVFSKLKKRLNCL
jgi:hypothetical protein